MTSLLQPLDVKINGVLKSHVRKLWRMEQLNDPYKEPKLSNGVKQLLVCCNLLKKSTIIDSFDALL